MAKYNSRYTGEEIDAKHGAHIFDSNTNELLHFGSKREKDEYVETSDVGLVLGRTRFDFQGTQYKVFIENLMGNTALYYTKPSQTQHGRRLMVLVSMSPYKRIIAIREYGLIFQR